MTEEETMAQSIARAAHARAQVRELLDFIDEMFPEAEEARKAKPPAPPVTQMWGRAFTPQESEDA